MSKEKVQQYISNITLGYGDGKTVNSALKSLVPKYNQLLGTNFSVDEVMVMMDGESIISCRGLDNYFHKVFSKMEESKSVLVAIVA